MSDRTALIEDIRRLAAGGHTARAIAEQLGVTRNTVIGICHRRHIQLWAKQAGTGANQFSSLSGAWTADEDRRLVEMREAGLRHGKIAEELGRTALACERRLSHLRYIQHRATPLPDAPDHAAASAGWPGPRQCRWIEGDVKPAPHWCKRRTDTDRSYCDEHHSRVWVRPPPQRGHQRRV